MTLRQRIALILAAAALGMLAFPPFGHWSLALLAWIPLWAALRDTGFKLGTRLGVLFGMLLYAGTLTWLFVLFGPLALCLFFILALFTGLSGGLIGWASKHHPRAAWLPLFAACTFAAIEYFRCEWFWLRFPWVTAGTALGPNWLTPWLGVYGTGFLILLGTAAVACGGRAWRIAGSILLVALGIQRALPPKIANDARDTQPVILLQSEQCDFDSYLRTTISQQPKPGTIVVWPEYAAPYELDSRMAQRDRDKIAALTKQFDITLILGSQSSAGPRKHFNTAYTFDASGELGRHHKNRPVHFFNDGVAGTEAKPVMTRQGALGTTICFDNDYTEVDRRMVTHGAQALLVPSMDPARWPMQQRLMHQELFRLRAAENGRWLAVAATSGMTNIIDPHGHVRASLPPIDKGVLHGTIGLRSELTFYSRIGWILPWVLLVAAAVWTAVLMIQQAKRSRSGDRRS